MKSKIYLFFFLFLLNLSAYAEDYDEVKANDFVEKFYEVNSKKINNAERVINDLKKGRLELICTNLSNEILQKICSLTWLKDLDLAHSGLQQIPDEIGNLKQLTELSLRGNDLQTLPQSIGSLEHLETLRVSGNPLKSLPLMMMNLSTTLKEFDLAYDPIFDRFRAAFPQFPPKEKQTKKLKDFLRSDFEKSDDYEVEKALVNDIVAKSNELHAKHLSSYQAQFGIVDLEKLYSGLCDLDKKIKDCAEILQGTKTMLIDCLNFSDVSGMRENGHLIEGCSDADIGDYFCLSEDDTDDADKLFKFIKKMENLPVVGPLFDYYQALQKQRMKLVAKASIEKEAKTDKVCRRIAQLEAARFMVSSIEDDLDAYADLREQLIGLIQKGVVYRNQRFIDSMQEAEG